jgi:hypothetical protein
MFKSLKILETIALRSVFFRLFLFVKILSMALSCHTKLFNTCAIEVYKFLRESLTRPLPLTYRQCTIPPSSLSPLKLVGAISYPQISSPPPPPPTHHPSLMKMVPSRVRRPHDTLISSSHKDKERRTLSILCRAPKKIIDRIEDSPKVKVPAEKRF